MTHSLFGIPHVRDLDPQAAPSTAARAGEAPELKDCGTSEEFWDT